MSSRGKLHSGPAADADYVRQGSCFGSCGGKGTLCRGPALVHCAPTPFGSQAAARSFPPRQKLATLLFQLHDHGY